MKKKLYLNMLTERIQKNKDEVNSVKTDQEEEIILELETEETEETSDFAAFFNEVLKKLPKKTATVIVESFDKSKQQAEKILTNSKEQYENIFDEFLVGVDAEVRKKCYSTIHSATLTAAIIGCSPIPFSDAFLLVPVQLTMMSRLHKTFGQSWSENIGSALSKELIVVGLGRSVVGNLLKMVPAVGTVTGAAINGAVASTITGALGWVTVKLLNEGEDIFEDLTSFKGQFDLLFKALKDSNKKTL